MIMKVSFVFLLHVVRINSLNIHFEDDDSNKEVLIIHDRFPMKDENNNFDVNNKDFFMIDDDLPLVKNNDGFPWADNKPHKSQEEDDESSEDLDDSFDSWSLVWYIASFGGLIVFFLVVSCSEWCCRKQIREQQARRGASSSQSSTPTAESPPPAYDLFAPPSYESLNYAGTSEKTEYDIYVVPVHAIGSLVDENNTRQGEENPPSYSSVSDQRTNNQRLTDV